MPKAKKKVKKKAKRVMTCGKCKGKGHNARTCTAETPTVVEATTLLSEDAASRTMTYEEIPEEPSPRSRPAPTADRGTAATAAPYRCSKCNAVDILVIVRVKDHGASFKKKREIFKGEQRCQSCMNKPQPAELILVWGAKPGQTVSEEIANAANA